MATPPDASDRTEDRLDADSEHRIWRPVSRRTFLKLAPVGAAVVLGPVAGTALATAGVQGAQLNIVAHEDDDLLFLSPSLLHAIHGGGPIRTIFVTAGDAGSSSTYWHGRESGIRAAYAQMAGVSNNWDQADAGISGHPMPVYTLSGAPSVSVIFMHMPDGNQDGSGFSGTNYESLQKLWTGTVSSVGTVDGSSSYTKSTLVSTLASLITAFQPVQLNTQDYVGAYGDGDHSDHHTVAYLARAAVSSLSTPPAFTGYQDYPDTALPANVSGADLQAKTNAFYTYTPFDTSICQTPTSCASHSYPRWLQRQYTVSQAYPPSASAGPHQTVQPGAAVRLDGSGSSDRSGNALAYQWTQTGGTAVSLSSASVVQPTFTAPSGATTLSFQLVVSNGQSTSSPATVLITVGNGGTGADLALIATATASSQNTSTGQTASKANNGVIDGYPGDFTQEWATIGGGAGSWLNLTWGTAQTVDKVVLYDRPNTNDQITGGTLQFSDGSTVDVGTLPDDGSALTVTFPARNITTVRLSITSVSATTKNAGLAEIQVYSQ